ncbi:MAG: DUF5659 domain-containing protein [Candidatus Firestonebacteria bacterium]
MNNNFENEFHTKDLPLICALMINGNPVSKTYRNGKEVFFVFDNKNKCEKLADDFSNHKLKVDAYQFSKLLKQIRNFIKDQF